jgi:hypothetical protein
MENLTCTSWLNGKHSANIEINTRLPYVALYDFFAQGENAEEIINEINEIYNNEKLNFTPLQACEYWASSRL